MILPEFNQQSNDDLSRLLFGGTLKVCTKEPVLNPDGTVYVFKTGARKGEIKLTNVQKDVILSGLGLDPIGEPNQKGIYKTNEGILQELLKQGENEVLSLILEIRGLNKLLGTYYRGLLELIEDDQCVRGQYQHVITVTGRTSMKSPNLQNISGNSE